jgi:hypothetical protein
MKILFSCPILDIRYEWFIGFISIWEQLRKRKNLQMGLFMPYRKPVDVADTAMVREAIKGDFDYILRMDDDVWDVPEDAVQRLLDADKDMISAVMYANSFHYQKCALIKKDKLKSLIDIAKDAAPGMEEANGSGVVPVDLTAFPFTLFKTSLFKKLPEPWFSSGEGAPEDSYFCQKMLDNGFQPYVHMDIQVNHRGVTAWNRLYRFVADARYQIDMGSLKKGEMLYDAYLEVKEKLKDIENMKEE